MTSISAAIGAFLQGITIFPSAGIAEQQASPFVGHRTRLLSLLEHFQEEAFLEEVLSVESEVEGWRA
jgi:hypothetical protein